MFTINEITNAKGNIGWAVIKDKTSIVKEFTSIEAACAYLDAVEDGEAASVALPLEICADSFTGDVVTEYGVYDSEGNFVASFDTLAEAEQFVNA